MLQLSLDECKIKVLQLLYARGSSLLQEVSFPVLRKNFVCTRVALQFVHEMQEKAQKNFDASRDKSLPVFGVGVVFVDESSARCVPTAEADEVIQHIKTVASDLAAPEKLLHIAPLESIYASNPADGRERLRRLLDAISDNTGKEDALTYLRMLCLQKVRHCMHFICGKFHHEESDFLNLCNAPCRSLWKMGTLSWYLGRALQL